MSQNRNSPKFSSEDLLILAHDEWKRREERKHIHEMRSWESGFINGFCTDKQFASDIVKKIRDNAKSMIDQPCMSLRRAPGGCCPEPKRIGKFD